MKILLIHVCFSESFQTGINPIVFGTYETLKKQGHEVYIFAGDAKPYYDESYEYSKYFTKSATAIPKKNKLTHLKVLLNSSYNIQARKNLEKMLNEIKPDIVHIHTTLDISFSVLKPIKKRKIPVIYTFHDTGLLCPALFNTDTINCIKCKGFNVLPCTIQKCVNGSFIKSICFSFKALMERYLGAFRDIDRYITVSEATKNCLSNYNIDEKKINVLPNFISKNLMVSPSENQESKYFFYAGGIHKIKGIYTLLKAIKYLPKEIEFHIAGTGNYDDLKNFIEDNKLNNIKFLGQLTKEQMQEEYKNCISVIMPSEWFETFGMINVEAAIYAKPSISSNIGGLSEVVENNKTGLIFEPKNVEQLKECILKYWNNRELVIEHGKNAREKVLREYNEDVYFEKLLKIYEDVLKI